MSLTRLSLQEDYKPIHHLQKEQNKERLLKIQQKLQNITQLRQNQQKDDLQEMLTKRVTQLQVKVTEEVKEMQAKMRTIREEFCTLKLRQAELTKKNQLSRKTRQIQISQLHKKLLSSLSFEEKETKQSDLFLSKNIDDKCNAIAKQINETQVNRIADFNCLDENLERQLPTTHLATESSSSRIENQLEFIHKELKGKINELKQSIEHQTAEKQLIYKKTMEMVNSVVDEIKKDLQEQKRNRELNKQKLMALFGTASGKLNLTQ